MKSKHLLTILPLIALLSACAPEVKIPSTEDAKLTGTALTATPAQLVVYPNDRPSIPDGKPVYAQNCASCHSESGGGGGDVAVKFDQQWARQIKPVDIYRLTAFGYLPGHSKFYDEQHKHEPFSGKLSTRQLWDVVAYTKSLGQPAMNDTELAAVDPVFGSNCAVCHGTKGDGDGPLARGLDPMPANFQRFDRFYNRTDDVLFDHIANGIRWEGMPNFLGKQDRKKNVKFDEAYIRKLVQYVHKFHINNAAVLTASASTGSAGAPAAAPAADKTAGQPSTKTTDEKTKSQTTQSTTKTPSGER
jgi:mono/diheme cytochrome c family protein